MGTTAAGQLLEARVAGRSLDPPGPVLVAVLVAVSVADIATTYAALTHGAAELSPIGRHIVGHGPVAMVAAKALAALAVGVPRWYGRRICLAGLAGMTAVAVAANAAQLGSVAGVF